MLEMTKTEYPENLQAEEMVYTFPFNEDWTGSAETTLFVTAAFPNPPATLAVTVAVICPPLAFPFPLLLTKTKW